MRWVVWSVVGIAVGLRAGLTARSRIVDLRKSGEVFGEAHVAHHALTVPIMALLGGAILALASLRFAGDMTVAAHVVFVGACLHLSLVDIDTHLLPRRTTYGALLLGLFLLFVAAVVDHEGSFTWSLLGALIMWMVLTVLGVLSRGDLGGGDIALGLLLGAFLAFDTPWDIASALVLGFLAAGVFAMGLLVMRRANRRTRFPFGPFLIAGALVLVLR